MNMFTTFYPAFDLLRARYLSICKYGLEKAVDAELVTPIKKLNGIAGVVTIFSCESHPETRRGGSKFYIMFALKDEGVDPILRIIQDMANLASVHLEPHTIEFNRTMRDFSTMFPDVDRNTTKAVTTFSVTAICHVPLDKTLVLNALNTAISTHEKLHGTIQIDD